MCTKERLRDSLTVEMRWWWQAEGARLISISAGTEYPIKATKGMRDYFDFSFLVRKTWL